MVQAYLILVYVLAYIGLFGISFYVLSLFTYYKKKKIPEFATDKTVSILIPAYNEEESIAPTIESALKLDYPKNKLQIVVIDDGSTDNTYKIAKKFESDRHPKVKVYRKKNGGKSSALNFGIKHSKSEIVFSMDADTFASPDALKRMIAHFFHERVMSVTPSMGVYKPKSFWARIQQIEYYVSVFIRKSFSTVNAIHITPGAFSGYRRAFFDKYGGYDEHDITEDLEIALRIQSYDYVIENAAKASVHTVAPNKFKSLLIQRKRWYTGLMRGFWKYRKLFHPSKGALGVVVLPIAVVTVVMSLVLAIYLTTKALLELGEEMSNLAAINFEFQNVFELNSFVFEHFFYSFFSHKAILITLFFVVLIGFYLYFSKKQMNYKDRVGFNFLLFVAFYSFLFTFWWMVSIVYVIFNREIVWRGELK